MESHQREVWHLFHQAAQVQGRLETHLSQEEERLRTITRYEQRKAEGQRCSGRPPKTSRQEQHRAVEQLMHLWEALAYLFQELHHLLEVVIVDGTSASGLLSASDRQQELETVVSLLFDGWAQAVRASSVVENWHSIVRPHLAVHRTLSAGMLALLAVWHNHRVAPRGPHADLSPLQRSQAAHVEADWLTALGYLSAAA